MMIPGEVLIVNNFKTISNLGMIDTYTSLFIPYAASVLYIYMLRECTICKLKTLGCKSDCYNLEDRIIDFTLS